LKFKDVRILKNILVFSLPRQKTALRRLATDRLIGQQQESALKRE